MSTKKGLEILTMKLNQENIARGKDIIRYFKGLDKLPGCVFRDYDKDKDLLVSTIDLHILAQGPSWPIEQYETMIFGGEHDQYMERSRTLEQAKETHDRLKEMAGI